MNIQDEIKKQFDWELQTKPYRRMEVELNKDIDEQTNNISLVRHRFFAAVYHDSIVYGEIENVLRLNAPAVRRGR